MIIDKKIILFMTIIAICLAAQSYDNYTKNISKSALETIDLLTD